MRKPIWPPVLLALALLAGCALFQSAPLTTQQTVECGKAAAQLQVTCNTAVDAIEKSSVLLAAINTTLDDALKAKTLLKVEVASYRALTKKADADLDTAWASLVKLDFTAGLTKANLVNDALLALQKEVAAQIAKKGPQ